MTNKQIYGQHFDVFAESVSGSAVATEAASAGRIHYITDIAASSPIGTCRIELMNDGTILWKNIIGSGGYIEKNFSEPLALTSGNAATLRAGTADVIYINLGGFTI